MIFFFCFFLSGCSLIFSPCIHAFWALFIFCLSFRSLSSACSLLLFSCLHPDTRCSPGSSSVRRFFSYFYLSNSFFSNFLPSFLFLHFSRSFFSISPLFPLFQALVFMDPWYIRELLRLLFLQKYIILRFYKNCYICNGNCNCRTLRSSSSSYCLNRIPCGPVSFRWRDAKRLRNEVAWLEGVEHNGDKLSAWRRRSAIRVAS